jgi:hypothetical protein
MNDLVYVGWIRRQKFGESHVRQAGPRGHYNLVLAGVLPLVRKGGIEYMIIRENENPADFPDRWRTYCSELTRPKLRR